ncbi:MAG: hypothetical protein V7603_4710 [Micromonosporaceae bacterium]
MSTPNFDEQPHTPPAQDYPTAQIPAVQGYPEPGYAEQGYAERGYAEQGYAEQGYAEQDHPAAGWSQPPVEPGAEEPKQAGREVGIAAVVAAVIAALGLGLGAIWSAVAPWVPAMRTADGAILAQPEQEQMIAGEGWYLIITVLAGVAVAVLAWLLLRRHRGVPVLLGMVVGSVAAGLLAFWLGHHIGLSHARYLADHAAVGTTFSIPPNLRAQQVGLWQGWLPYVKGDVLAMAIAAVVTYILLAGFSQYPTLRPAPRPAEQVDEPAAPVNSGW